MTLMIKKMIAGTVATLALVGVASIAQAAVTDGSFQGNSFSAPLNGNQDATNAQTQALAGWNSTGYGFIFTSPSASIAEGQQPQGGHVSLIGVTAAPGGSNFVAFDPAYENAGYVKNQTGTSGISQTVSGLTIGATYTLTFDWAAAQQSGFSGDTTEFWKVDLGNAPAQSTTPFALPSGTFSGWMGASFDFVANATSETLSFLAGGGPESTQPPFDLLTNIALTKKVSVPEPASIALFGAGLVGFAGFAARRRKNKKS